MVMILEAFSKMAASVVPFVPMISAISDIFLAIAAIVGIQGLHQWRLQLKFGDQYKTAHSIWGLSLRFKREFELIRHQAPLSLLTEDEAGESEWIANSQRLVGDFYERKHHIDMLYEITEKLYNASIEVEGYLGEREAEITLPFEEAYKKLFEAFGDYEKLIHSLESQTCNQETIEKFQRSRPVLFPADGDLLEAQVRTAVRDTEKRLSKYLK